MPVVLVELAPMAIALFAMLCAIAVDWLIRQIGNAIGSVGIGPVSWDIGKFFYNQASNVIGWCVQEGQQYFGDIGNWMYGHAYILQAIGGATVSAIGHLGDQIAHIVTTEIPNAISALGIAVGEAIDQAINTVYGEAQTMVNNAYGTLHTLIDSTWLNTEALVSNDYTTLKDYVDQQVGDAEKTAAALYTQLTNEIGNALTGVASNAWTAMGNGVDTLTQDIANAETAAETYARNKANDAYTAAETDITNLGSTLGGEITTAEGNISTLAGTVAGNLTAAETYARNEADNAYTSAETDLKSDVGSLGGEISSLAGTVAGDLTAAETYARNAADNAYTSAETDLTTDVGLLGGAIGTLGGTIATDVGALPGQITAAISLSLAPVLARVATLEECSVGVCDTSPNNFSNLLSDALGVVSFAEFATFIGEAIHDPQTAGQEFAGAAQGFYNTASNAVSDVGSVINAILSL